MHLRFSLATVALLGLCASTASVQANELPQPKVGPTSVALVDVGYLIQNHPTMKGEVESIRLEMENAQKEMDARRKDLMAQSEQVGKTYDSSSPDFKQKQQELINKESTLRVDFMEKEKEFAERHAGLLARSYKEITDSIQMIANHYKFDLVIRYSKEQDEMDPKKPRTVEFGVQKDVLFRAENMDVTPHVMYVLTSKYPGAAQPAATSQAAAPNAQTANRPAGAPQTQRPVR